LIGKIAMDLPHTSPGKHPRTVTEFKEAQDRLRSAIYTPPPEVSYGAQTTGPQLWNQGLRLLTNRTRLPGEPALAGMNLYYYDQDWNGGGPGGPLGVILREDDQQPGANVLDAGGTILPWCSNSKEVRAKAIIIDHLGDDGNTVGEDLLYLFQYYWDNVGYYLPVNFTSFSQKVSMGEGPSSYLDVDFALDSAGNVMAGAVAA
jgi:hypothetical protein